MRPLLLALCLPAPALAGDFYYPTGDLEPVDIVDDGIGLLLGGTTRAWRTGDLVLETFDADTLDVVRDLPEVAYVAPLHAERGLYSVIARGGVDEVALSTRIAPMAGVGFCHPDFAVEMVPHTLNDPMIGDAWHLDNVGQRGGLPGVDVGAFDAWTEVTGQGMLIAILDTGVDPDHPDLDQLQGYDFGDTDDDPTPDPEYGGHGHGTAMAGIAAATGDNGIGTAGIAPDAQILPIKFLGDEYTQSDMYQAFVYAADEGAHVLSNSWGAQNGCAGNQLSGLISSAFDYVETEGRDGLGAVIVKSMGNDGCDNSADQFHTHPAVIAVGAASDIDRRIGYSNYGDHIDVMGFAGGDGRPGLVTTDVLGDLGYSKGENGAGDYWYGGSGTSSAGASVAGVVALIIEANPQLTAAQVRDVLCETAVKPAYDDANWDADGWSRTYGCGRVDAWAAVQAVKNELPQVEALDPGEVRVDDGVLAWTVTDPDGERVAVRLQVRAEVSPDPVIDEVLSDTTEFEVSGLLRPGARYLWTLTPADGWGEGETVEGVGFTVLPPATEEVGACSTTPVSGAGVLVLLAGLLGLARRRRQ